MLIARAAGLPINQGYILARHEDWKDNPKYVVRELSVELDAKFTQVEAKQRLAILCEMARTALVSPCASFGKTATAEEQKMKGLFNAFVSSDAFHASKESIIFGSEPKFEEVFYLDSPASLFWQQHKKLFTFPRIPDIDETPIVHVIS